MKLVTYTSYRISGRDNWHRIQNNDTRLTKLTIQLDRNRPAANDLITDDAEIEELGRDIGNNTHLRTLMIEFHNHTEDSIAEAGRKCRLLCEGINNNRSIERIHFNQPYQVGGEMLQFLSPFFTNNNNLQEIRMQNVLINREEMRSLTTALTSREHPLRLLYLWETGIDDDSLIEEFVNPFRENARLIPRKLDLWSDNTGRNGCESIAALLQNPACAMEELSLRGNQNINNDSPTIFADALVTNRSLKSIDLLGPSGTHIDYSPFLQVVFNNTTINDTYFMSNHTLATIEPDNHLPADLQQYLQLNMHPDKRYVARRKVLTNHFSGNINMKPFEEMAPELLMRAINFLDTCDQESREKYAAARCSIIFQLIKSDPMMICKD